MSRLLSRVLLAILMFPLASVAYLVVYFATLEIGRNSQYGDALYYGMSGAATWGLVAMYWFSLWRGSVGWTERRRRATLLGAGAAVVGGVVTAALLWWIDDDFAAFIGSITTPLLWLTWTIFIWRDDVRGPRPSTGDAASVVCPACGYSMTGLTEARCPECGSRFTLDELYASQPQQRATADLK